MANIFAVISKAIFEKQAKGLDVGDVHAIASYDSNPAAFAPLRDGGTVFVVTARPGDVLWLVAVLDGPRLKGGKWVAPTNTTPIIDITKLIPKLKFASGNGLHAKPGQLGMSLQTPRALADEDVKVIAGMLDAKPAKSTKSMAALPAGAKAAKTSVRPDLERALASGDADDYLVYADVLQQRGDPRGELIHTQHALGKKPKDKALKAAEAKLFKDHADALLGPLARFKKSLTWKLGFVDTATFDGKAEVKRVELDAILDHPSMAHVRELKLSVGHSAAPGVVLRLAGKPRPALRVLELRQGASSFDYDDGDVKPTYSTEWDEHDHKKGDVVWAAVPNLESLYIGGFGLFHSLSLPHLKRLDLYGVPLCGKVPMSLPEVETISVQLDEDDTGTGVDWSTEQIAIAWTSKTPKLRKLDLDECSSVGYMDYETYAEDGDGDEEIDDHLAWALRRDKKFKKLVTQLDELALPGEILKGKAIATWLKA